MTTITGVQIKSFKITLGRALKITYNFKIFLLLMYMKKLNIASPNEPIRKPMQIFHGLNWNDNQIIQVIECYHRS